MPDSSDNYQLPSWPPTPINRDLWNAVMGSIGERLLAREELEADFEALIAQGTQASLDYIQATVAPQIASLQTSIELAQEQIDQIIVDGIAPNAAKLGGQLPVYYAPASALPLKADVTYVDSELLDLATAIQLLLDQKAGATETANALANRLRFDAAQARTPSEQGRAWANIGGSREDDDQIINGCFDLAQRGQTQSIGGYGSVDRWISDFVGGAAVQSQQAFSVGDTLGSCCKPFFGRQTVSGQSAAGHYALRVQKIEDVRSYAGQTITILGWARRSSGAGDMVVEGVQLFGGGGSPSAPVTGIGSQKVTLSSLWQPFAVTMNVPSIAGKTLGTDNKHCFAPHFWASAGANWSARALNLGLQTVGIDLFGVHIRKGVVPVEAANFYSPPKLESVIADCQRFFEAGPTDCSGVTHAGNGDTRGSLVAYSVIKRSTPVVTFSTTTISIFCVTQNGSAPNLGGAISGVRSYLNGWSISGIANYASISAVLGGGDFAWGLSIGPTYYSDAEI